MAPKPNWQFYFLSNANERIHPLPGTAPDENTILQYRIETHTSPKHQALNLNNVKWNTPTYSLLVWSILILDRPLGRTLHTTPLQHSIWPHSASALREAILMTMVCKLSSVNDITLNLSLYSVIGDFFMILRLLKDMVLK